ncbi:MAG: BtpA/SgcQ family protein [Oscillospiraceae bacterium]|nr:BtpA/SgcQ family protein [Oscillospiraceae bacterium]
MNSLEHLIEKMKTGHKCIVGMIHCLPLPGTLYYSGDMEAIYARALSDAAVLEQTGADAVMVENMGDIPLAAHLEPEQIAALAAVTRLVVERVNIPVGVDASFNDGAAGIAVACAAGASFIRSPVFVDNVQATGLGIMRPCAKETLRCRRLLGAEHIGIWADVQVKHTHATLPGVTLEESAVMAYQCGAQVLIVTGDATGHAASPSDVARVKKAVPLPVVVGSGFSHENAREQLAAADGAIVGSSIKKGGDTRAPINPGLSKSLIDEARRARKGWVY